MQRRETWTPHAVIGFVAALYEIAGRRIEAEAHAVRLVSCVMVQMSGAAPGPLSGVWS